MGKSGYGEKSLKWIGGIILTLATLPMNVLSRSTLNPINYGKEVPNQIKMDNNTEETLIVLENIFTKGLKDLSNNVTNLLNNLSEHNTNITNTLETFSCEINNILFDTNNTLKKVQNMENILPEILKNMSLEILYHIEKLNISNLITNLNTTDTFLNSLKPLEQNIKDLQKSVIDLHESNANQLDILNNLTQTFQQNATLVFEYFKNQSNEALRYAATLANDYTETRNSESFWYISLPSANLILTGAIIVSAYAAYRKINTKLDNIEVRGRNLLEKV